MKSTKNNEALIEALGHVQAAARAMSRVSEGVDTDPLLRVSSADDELDFQELSNIAESLHGDLCALVPKLRLLLYVGAPKGTVYKKVKSGELRANELAALVGKEASSD